MYSEYKLGITIMIAFTLIVFSAGFTCGAWIF